MITGMDIAWAAGFLEGEGSFVNGMGATMSALQVQREPLDRLQRMFKGSVIRSYRRDRPEHQPYHTWQVGGSLAISIMMTILPLMSPRRTAQIVAVITKWKTQRGAKIKSSPYCSRGHDERVVGLVNFAGSGRKKCAACVLGDRLKDEEKRRARRGSKRRNFKNPRKIQPWAAKVYAQIGVSPGDIGDGVKVQ